MFYTVHSSAITNFQLRPINTTIVFECKVRHRRLSSAVRSSSAQYELDSLCGFLKLSRAFYQNSNDSSFINDNCESSLS